VLLVGIVAVADAVRQKAAEPEVAANAPVPQTTTTQASPATGLSGVLFYTDAQCRLVGRRLPNLNSVQAPTWSECGFSLSHDAQHVAAEGFVWHPGGSVRASQSEGSVALVLQEGSSESSYTFRGSAPSFNEQALLTFALGAEIRAMGAGCPLSRSDAPLIPARDIRSCSNVVVPAEAVERAARRHPNADVAPGLLNVSVREMVWLGAQEAPVRLAALLRLRVRGGETYDLVGVFEGGGIVEVFASLYTLSDLKGSPGGSYFGVLSRGPVDLFLFDRETRALPLPPVTGVRAFEWSPDEDWIALATAADVYVDLTERRQFTQPPRPRRLGIVAEDLAWR
jgi:hypothetical protein